MAIITLFTVDVRDNEGKPSIVGYAFFPLFLDRDTKEQPETEENTVASHHQNFFLNNGDYQIPLFCQDFYQKKPFLYKDQ